MSTDQHPNEADKADDGKASGNEGFHLDCPPLGLRTVFPRKLRVLDLFSGCGAYALGLKRAGIQTVAFCENDPARQADLARLFPGVPIYGDVTTLTAARLAADGIYPNAIIGGFPCQDLSTSGSGAGLHGERSGLWFEFLRLIRELGPDFVGVENSTELLSGWIGEILGALADLGFDAEWESVPAAAFGAPHLRWRTWILAYASRLGLSGQGGLLDAIHPTPDAYREASGLIDAFQRGALPFVCGRHDGVARRVAESGLHAIGNANPPQILEWIGGRILQSLNDTGSKGTDGPRFAVSDFPFCHAGENDHD